MVACARIVAPRAAVALQQQRRVVGTAFAAAFSLAASCGVIGTEYRSVFFTLRFLPPPLADFGIINFGRTG